MKKAMLIVLDGWGVRKERKDNAVELARKPNFDKLWKSNPHTTLYAAEEHVGLPSGFIGNSEVGHLNLGSGRVMPQELVKIDNAIESGELSKNKVLLSAMKSANKNDSALHFLGLLSDGGVHSHIRHLLAMLDMAKKNKVRHVYVHCFLDGRDVPPASAMKYIKMLQLHCRKIQLGSIATIMGRYYAMDRDNRWNREHKAYDAMVNGAGYVYGTVEEALAAAYKRGETDEFVKPSIILSSHRHVKHHVNEGDSIIFYNFREDRAREITRAFVDGRFRKFRREKKIRLNFVCLTQYDKKIKAPVAFPPSVPKDVLGEVASRVRIRQLRIAETEKYAHVTYFFNGGREGPFAGEDRVMIPSPHVSTYDHTPAMSAFGITKELLTRLTGGRYNLIILNYANADMVGHTGMLKPTIKAVEAVDECLGKIVPAARKAGFDVIVTADHGNAEEMAGKYKTSHTLNKVPFIVVSDRKWKITADASSSIAQMSPTILTLLGMKKPSCYEKSLIG
jgi:2,3-bisphosphoglycerate-independent phosphoglycerate mutase